MAKTGGREGVGTAEGAVLGRAAHTLHAKAPILDDFWAVELLTSEAQAVVRDPEHYRAVHAAQGSSMALVSVTGLACLRFAEDEVERQVGEGARQYVVLGAGFDTFALRRRDLTDRFGVFEVDHPDVQALKRERIARAPIAPATLPEYVPVDFESMSLAEGLERSSFDPTLRSVVSWMNTLPYLSEAGVAATLSALSDLTPAGSRVIANYVPSTPPTPEQAARLEAMGRYAAAVGERQRTFWDPAELEALVGAQGFTVAAHVTERDLEARYFAGRDDGLRPGIPQRILVAERG